MPLNLGGRGLLSRFASLSNQDRRCIKASVVGSAQAHPIVLSENCYASNLKFLLRGTGTVGFCDRPVQFHTSTGLNMANHLRFVARTVMVQEGNVDTAYKALNRVLSVDGVIETVKRKRYYEKPCRQRQRENYENCRRIYHTEMARKISFVSRTHRQDPWIGC